MLRKRPSNACFDWQHYLYLFDPLYHIYGTEHKLERDANLIVSLQITHQAQANRRGWPHHRGLRPLFFSNSGEGSFTSHKNQISESAMKRFFVLIR